METKLYTREDIDLIKDLLLEGKIVAFPTDTVFGLACVYDDEEAVRRIYEAKGRDFSKPLPMMVSTADMAQEVSVVTREAGRLLDAFAPGAFTIVLKKKDLPDYVTMGKDTIAIRIPDDAWIRDLINRTGKPLLVTSANLSDTGSLQEWKDVYEELNGRIDAIVKGTAPGGTASTIVSVVNGVEILREGPIAKEEIEEALLGNTVLFTHAHLVLDGNTEYLDGAILVEEGKIEGVYPHSDKVTLSAKRVIDLEGKIVMPAFFDPDVRNGDTGRGVTAYIETVLHDPEETPLHIHARKMGTHLDGPYVNPDLSVMDYEEQEDSLSINTYLERYPDTVSVTLAYELIGSEELSSYLEERGILRLLGRSRAHEEDLGEYEGFRPLFKDMEGISPKGDDLVSIALHSEKYVECDPSVLGDRTLDLIRKNVSRKKLILCGGQMEEGVKRMRKLGASFPDLLLMSSLNAYTLYGKDTLYGSLRRGKSADLLIMDEEGNVLNVYTEGVFLYD